MIVSANPLQKEIDSMLRQLGFDLREGVYLLPAASLPVKKNGDHHSPVEQLTSSEEPREKPE